MSALRAADSAIAESVSAFSNRGITPSHRSD